MPVEPLHPTSQRFRFCFLVVAILFLSTGAFPRSAGYVLYVGTYTQGASQGIYAYRFDEKTGRLSSLGLASETVNPSFLTVDRAGKLLYAVNEVQKYQGASTGAVSSFSIDHSNWKLKPINQVASGGTDPCYIALDRSGKYLLIANYTGGTVAVIPVAPDGRLSEASSVLKNEGAPGPVKDRQEGPHAHFIEASAGNRFAYVADLGFDRILIYRFDAEKGVLSRGPSTAGATDFFSAKLAPGTGPRHLAFSADGKFMYVIGELDSTVTVFRNAANQTYRAIQKISALPAGFAGNNTAAEIAIHPNGKFLYTSNRGDDSIAVFTIDQRSGRLTFVERVSSGGKAPRNFAIDPEGSRLLAANQDSGNIVEFTIDKSTGRLTAGGEVAKLTSPVCLVFLAAE
jgi:6-phosphogluconolactonase